MGVNGAWHLADRLHFSLYTIVDMEFFDKKPDIIRAIVSQPEILLFTTMHGIAKIVDRYGDALRCRLPGPSSSTEMPAAGIWPAGSAKLLRHF